MGYVLVSANTGKFVTPPGMAHSYTADIRKARVFRSKQEAERERCENEVIIPVSSIAKAWEY